ncbi:hypothetical protein L6452_33231 [Arctium lappa]|uniref:Uncharacterized protein n=1 Tax=Arctium lappa TaxID=4217 RepID=A0ACB8Z6Q8_ARCLA|nr:hypothetical protein L6452_33231 [Arctium lappa]
MINKPQIYKTQIYKEQISKKTGERRKEKGEDAEKEMVCFLSQIGGERPKQTSPNPITKPTDPAICIHIRCNSIFTN